MELKDRLKTARKNAGLKQSEVASSIDGLSQPAYSQLESGASKTSTKLIELANLFGVDADWLATGNGSMEKEQGQTNGLDPNKDYALANTEPVTLPLRRIPILNWVQAGILSEIGDDCYDEWDVIHDDGYGQNVYGLHIRGDSMTPEFNQGDLIVIDQDREAVAGNFVIARVDDDNTATFKKYKPRGFDENTGKEYFQLVPLNTFYPTVDSRFIKIRIVGVVVEHKRKLV